MPLDDITAAEDDATRREWDRSNPDASASAVVREAIDSHEGTGVPGGALFERIDPDALDDLFTAAADETLIVRVRFDDLDVSLWGDGAVEVEAADGFDR